MSKINMGKIKKMFNSKNMKIIIPVIVLVVLLIIVFIYLSVYKYNNYRDKRDYQLYQYFGGEKFEYEATISFNKKEVIKAFVPKEYKINFNSQPIYYSDKDINEAIFPNPMIMILPLKRESQYKIPEFTYIKKIGSLQYFNFEDYHKNIDHYVLYNGNDLYFFSDSVTFTIEGEEIKISPLSYMICGTNEISYYDYETDTYQTSEIHEEVIVSNEFYTVNVSNDNIIFLGEPILITNNFDFLNTLN